MKLRVFEKDDELIVCAVEDTPRIIEEYFKEGTGRDIEDYDSYVTNDLRITPTMHVRAF